jgi:hypothetical protein
MASFIVFLLASTVSASTSADSPDTYGLVDPSSGMWHLHVGEQEVTQFLFGDPGDYAFMGDWNCDGVDTPGLYRQSDGYVYLRNSNTEGIADLSFFFGNPGDVPVAGDFNADGCDTVSIYRPSQQQFYIINKLGTNDGGLGAAEYSFLFGDAGDKPFIGDFNGNGQDTVGLHRESTGLVYFRNTLTTGNADNQFIFGNPGDRFVAGDWTGDSVDSPGVFRPSNTTMYLRYQNTQGNADETWENGESEWLPVAGTLVNCMREMSIPAVECEALIALYESTNGSAWNNSEGWIVDPDPCGWYGVTCSGGSVTELGGLIGNLLTGVLPPELGNLTNLTRLDLAHNWITGDIPSELGNLTNLTYLALFTNQLTGTIPPELGKLTNLEVLILGPFNQLTGPIPPELGNLTSLVRLGLDWNQLSGPIPPELGSLSNLVSMELTGNRLSGPIPPELGNLDQLLHLYLHDNELSGPIPSELGDLTVGNTGLLNLFLEDNHLSGVVPPELRNLIWLNRLRLSGQTECLTATDPELADWLTSFDANWNDGCR